jgi:hypothetical protein
MRNRIQLFTSVQIGFRIRIQGAKPMKTHADPDLDPDQTLPSKKLNFCMKNILYVGNRP